MTLYKENYKNLIKRVNISKFHFGINGANVSPQVFEASCHIVTAYIQHKFVTNISTAYRIFFMNVKYNRNLKQSK